MHAAPHTADLFSSPPGSAAAGAFSYQALAAAVIAREPATYDAAFRAWLAANRPLWTRFCQVADRLRNRRAHHSARAIFHHLRLETDLAEQPVGRQLPAFKINNNHSALCARLYNALSPDRAGFFRTRDRLQGAPRDDA
jgi:hypothetical protein